MRACAKEIVASNGVVRSLENHGVRQLPYRFKVSARFDPNHPSHALVYNIMRRKENMRVYTNLLAKAEHLPAGSSRLIGCC